MKGKVDERVTLHRSVLDQRKSSTNESDGLISGRAFDLPCDVDRYNICHRIPSISIGLDKRYKEKQHSNVRHVDRIVSTVNFRD
jgi:hypothetical protein